MLTDSVKSDTHLRCERSSCLRPHVFVMNLAKGQPTGKHKRHLTHDEMEHRRKQQREDRTFQDAFDTLTDDQKEAHALLVGLMEDLDEGRDERMALIQYAKKLA